MRTKDILLLSGTPIKAVPIEAVPMLRCIDSLFTKEVEESFRKIYRASNNKGTDILANRLGLISFKVQKDELGLKEPIFHKVSLNTPNAQYFTLDAISIRMKEFVTQRKQYYANEYTNHKRIWDQALQEYELSISLTDFKSRSKFIDYIKDVNILIDSGGRFVDPELFKRCNSFEVNVIIDFLMKNDMHLCKEYKSIRSAIKYVGLKIQGECLGTIVGGARIDCHVEMSKCIDFKSICESSIKKTVVFTSFTEVLESCRETFKNQKLFQLEVYAKTNKDLPNIVKRFKDDERANPLIATYKSLSTAVPLTMADVMILIDSPWRDYVLQQAVSRIHRLDSNTQTNIYTFELDTGDKMNISKRSTEILKWSQKQIQDIIGISSPFMMDNMLNADEFNITLEGYNTSITDTAPLFISWK
jgi:hypothetical protein